MNGRPKPKKYPPHENAERRKKQKSVRSNFSEREKSEGNPEPEKCSLHFRCSWMKSSLFDSVSFEKSRKAFELSENGFRCGSVRQRTELGEVRGHMSRRRRRGRGGDRRRGLAVELGAWASAPSANSMEEEEEQTHPSLHGWLFRHDALRPLQRSSSGSCPRRPIGCRSRQRRRNHRQ